MKVIRFVIFLMSLSTKVLQRIKIISISKAITIGNKLHLTADSH